MFWGLGLVWRLGWFCWYWRFWVYYFCLISSYSPSLLYSFGVLATYPIFPSTLSLAPLQLLKTFWSSCACVCQVCLSILEFCQVYVVFVFIGALRVNSSLDTWEIDWISCEAISLLFELIDYLTMFEMLGWFSWLSWFFNSLHIGYYLFLSFPETQWEICDCFGVCLSLFNVSRFVPCSIFNFPQECKKLSVGDFDLRCV